MERLLNTQRQVDFPTAVKEEWDELYNDVASSISEDTIGDPEIHRDGDGRGDIGDLGIYTDTGGTSTAGLHPDMRRKVGDMMKANPRMQDDIRFA